MENFAGMPDDNGGGCNSLTSKDLNMKNDGTGNFLVQKNLWASECGNTTKGFLGGVFNNLNVGDILKVGGDVYTSNQDRKAAEQAAAMQRAKAEQERAKIAQLEAEAEIQRLKNEKSAGTVGIIKAYGTPIAITGVVVILGIVAYFFFKKKKIS